MTTSHRLHARCSAAGAGSPFTLSGTERKYERSRPFTISHLALELTLDFPRKSVAGVATIEFERVSADERQFELDAVGFELSRVELHAGKGWERASYEYDGDRLRVSVPARVKRGRVRVRYRATPRRGMYFLAPDEQVKDRPVQVWTQCQDEDARHFMPCHDKPHVKMTTELIAHVPAGFTVLSNGELARRDTPRGKKPWTYHFKMNEPHPSYLMTLVAGHFDVIEDRAARVGVPAREIPVTYYVPPGKKADGARSFGETPRMIELFSRLTGIPFPWSRYSQIVVSDFIFGGMENTTATTMYEYVLLDARAALDASSADLVAHELAHQWFGDHVTCRDWSHAWLNEGFATFFEHLEREDRLGRDEYDYGLHGDLAAYLGEASGRYRRAIVCRDYEHPIDLFDRHLYEKGGLVLHMLRRELGDEVFWRGIHAYLSGHAGGIVETNDLMRALEGVSGRSLERFFDQWVYRPGHPELRVQISYEHGLLSVSVKQTQASGETAVFAFPLEIELADHAGKTRRFSKEVTSANDALVLKLGERPLWVAFDPDSRVMGEVTLEVPADLLRAQLERGTTARERWAAAEALAKRDDAPTVAALAQALGNRKEAWMVRAEAAHALGRIKGAEAFAALRAELGDPHPKVRRAAASALGNFRSPAAAEALAPLVKKDPSYLVEAEASRALGRTRQPAALKALLGGLDRASWADVIRAGTLDGLSALRDERAVPEVLERSRYGVPTRGRRAAIAALAELSTERKVREHLELLLDDHDPYLRIDVVRALESMGDAKALGALRRALARELDGRVARRIREALRSMSDGGAADQKRVKDELETLRGELTELKARLGKLEGSGPAAKSPRKAATGRGASARGARS
ncbi:MAG: M1 family aminopeptidase [Sorangiineae bacterium]|nr:M1 family aminopeptidase [Polyangiaceae bacterium]MEB2325097.1 M1 family aminopeptidase [Sorangiineae bacterium]